MAAVNAYVKERGCYVKVIEAIILMGLFNNQKTHEKKKKKRKLTLPNKVNKAKELFKSIKDNEAYVKEMEIMTMWCC